MRIQFANELQAHIADLMWEAQDITTITKIRQIYGKEAEVVYNMLLAESFDQFNDTDIAEDVLTQIFYK